MVSVVAGEESFTHVLISLAILLFAAKIFAEIFHKFKLPIVLGELLAGIIVSPFALGAIPLFDGELKTKQVLDGYYHNQGNAL